MRWSSALIAGPRGMAAAPQVLLPLVVHASEAAGRIDEALAQLQVLSESAPPPVLAFNAVLAACSRAKVRRRAPPPASATHADAHG